MNLTYSSEEVTQENESYVEEVLLLLLLLKQKQLAGNFSQKEADITMQRIAAKRKKIDEFNAKWSRANVPLAVNDGVVLSRSSLGTLGAYVPGIILPLLPANKKLIDSVMGALDNDLANVTENIERRAKQSIREIVAASFRQQLAKKRFDNGVTAHIASAKLKQMYGEQVDNVITDSLGRRWKMKTYVDMLVNTTMMEATNRALINDAIDAGVHLGQITIAPGTKDSCRIHEGSLVRLDESVDAPYPTYDELKASGTIFHPQCRHRIVPYV